MIKKTVFAFIHTVHNFKLQAVVEICFQARLHHVDFLLGMQQIMHLKCGYVWMVYHNFDRSIGVQSRSYSWKNDKIRIPFTGVLKIF